MEILVASKSKFSCETIKHIDLLNNRLYLYISPQITTIQKNPKKKKIKSSLNTEI